MGLRITEMRADERTHPFPYGFWLLEDRQEVFEELVEWCTERFGPMSPLWKQSHSDFWFQRENHAMEFKLRWM